MGSSKRVPADRADAGRRALMDQRVRTRPQTCPAHQRHWDARSALNPPGRALLLALVSHMPRDRESFGLEWRPQALRGDGFPFGLDLKQPGAFHL